MPFAHQWKVPYSSLFLSNHCENSLCENYSFQHYLSLTCNRPQPQKPYAFTPHQQSPAAVAASSNFSQPFQMSHQFLPPHIEAAAGPSTHSMVSATSSLHTSMQPQYCEYNSNNYYPNRDHQLPSLLSHCYAKLSCTHNIILSAF